MSNSTNAATDSPSDLPNIDEMSFEQALGELEATVKKLEEGRGKIDEAVALFARGMKLRQHCEKKLAAAQSKIDKIIVKPDGSIELEAMNDG